MHSKVYLSGMGVIVLLACSMGVMLMPSASSKWTIRTSAAIEISCRDEIWIFEGDGDGIRVRIQGADGKPNSYRLDGGINGKWENEKVQRIVASVKEREDAFAPDEVEPDIAIGLVVESLSEDKKQLRYRVLHRWGRSQSIGSPISPNEAKLSFECTRVLAERPAKDPFEIIAVTCLGGDDMVITLQDIRRFRPNKSDLAGDVSEAIETHTFMDNCGVFWEYVGENQRMVKDGDRVKILPMKKEK